MKCQYFRHEGLQGDGHTIAVRPLQAHTCQKQPAGWAWRAGGPPLPRPTRRCQRAAPRRLWARAPPAPSPVLSSGGHRGAPAGGWGSALASVPAGPICPPPRVCFLVFETKVIVKVERHNPFVDMVTTGHLVSLPPPNPGHLLLFRMRPLPSTLCKREFYYSINHGAN